jgi:hypothetical protein
MRFDRDVQSSVADYFRLWQPPLPGSHKILKVVFRKDALEAAQVLQESAMTSRTTTTSDKKRKAAVMASDSDGSLGTFFRDKSKRELELEVEIEKLKAELKEAKQEIETLQLSTASHSAAKGQVESSDDDDDSEMETANDTWSVRFRELRDFRQVEGHCKVPKGYAQNKPLGIWVKNLKYNRKKSKVPQERVDKLDSIGFDWGKDYPPPELWDTTYAKVKEHVEMFNDWNFSSSSPLGKWCDMQRKERKSKKQGKPSLLSVEQLKTLNGLGFPWKRSRRA